MSEERPGRDFGTGSQVWHERVPRVEDALAKARPVTMILNDGIQVTTVVADHGPLGVLVDMHEASGAHDAEVRTPPFLDQGGYVFVPWTSIKYVWVPGNTERRKPGETHFSD